MLKDRKPISRREAESSGPIMDIQAENQIKYIRDVMSRATTFTAVPGKGMIGMGVIALVATAVALASLETLMWLYAWAGAVVVAPVLGFTLLVRKARRTGTSLRSGVGQKFILSFTSCIFVGFLLSIGLWSIDHLELMPGVWMLMYGVGTLTGGSLSIKVIPILGVLFIVFGAIALFMPLFWSNVLMGVTFGGLHLIFGTIITRNYGG